MKKIFILIVLGIFVNVWGQGNNPIVYTPDMFPKTPDGAILSKFVDIPAGSYTGVASFSIPLYTIEVEGKQFDISIDYSTSGIKVNDIASRVGLGWGLNAGGCTLSYQVMGSRDLINGMRPVITGSFAPGGDHITPMDDSEIALRATEADPLIFGVGDLEPDIYSYSLTGTNGRFILDSSGNPSKLSVSFPYNQVKIESYGSKITDESGIIYEFYKYGMVYNVNTCARFSHSGLQDPNYKIKTVTFPSGKRIDFSYNKFITAKYATSTSIKNLLDHTVGDVTVGGGSNCQNYTDLSDYLITEISFPEGTVYFYYNDDVGASARLDVEGDKYLKQVVVKNINGVVIRNYTLHYEYFLSDTSGNNYPYYPGYGSGIDKRLKLISVNDNLTGGDYTLEYYENHTLPPRFSYAVDYWGVYNGKDENDTYFPTVKYFRLMNPSDERIYTGDDNDPKNEANRDPDFNYGVTGNLKKITYPTGGYSEIEYEPDDYYDEFEDGIKYGYTLPQNHPDGITIYNEAGYDEQIFEVEGLKAYNFERLFLVNGGDPGPNTEIGLDCKARLYKLINNTEVEVNKIQDPGTYKYKFTFYGNGDPETGQKPECQATISWVEEYEEPASTTKKTGTIRVKQITKKEDNDVLIKRMFTYLDPTANYTRTSGKNHGTRLLSPLIIQLHPYVGYGANHSAPVRALYISNNPGWETNTINGKSVGYDYVQEVYQSTQNSAEKFEKEYQFSNEYVPSQEGSINSPLDNTYWPLDYLDRGMILKEKYFNAEGDSIKVIKNEYEKSRDYIHDNSSAHELGSYGWGIGAKINLKQYIRDTISNRIITSFEYSTFGIASEWIKQIKTTTTDYENGQPIMETEQTTAYANNPLVNSFPTTQSMDNSLGETLTTEYTYPQDGIHWQTDIMNQMVQKNMISTPVIVKTSHNGTPVSEQMTEYQVVNTDQILPQYVYAKKGTYALEKKITYNRYDSKGNLEQYTLADGTPVSIIWGYNGQYPIAKVEGKTYTEIASLAGTLQTASNNGTLTAGSFESLRSLGGAVVTGYIYQPLVGVTTIIQPNGQKETYEYDSFGRLKSVKDVQGNILRQIDYNYQQP